MRDIAIVVIATTVLGACGGGGGNESAFAVGLYVQGASNSECTLVVAHDDHSVTYLIGRPAPPVADTSLATRPPPSGCGPIGDGDAGVNVSVSRSPASSSPTAERSSTMLCLQDNSTALMTELGYSTSGTPDCPVTVTLTCAGVVLYDHVAWTGCRWLG